MGKIWETINAAPAEAWVGLIGVIAGSLLAIFAAWLTSKANRRQLKIQLEHEERMHRQRVAKERLEELYSLVTHWVNAIFSDSLYLTLVMEGHKDYNGYLDIINELHENKTTAVDFSRLRMILGIYGETLNDSYDKAIVVRDKIFDLREEHKQAYKSGKTGANYIKPLKSLQIEFDSAAEVLLADIAKVARQT
jgi:hypothetical protein